MAAKSSNQVAVLKTISIQTGNSNRAVLPHRFTRHTISNHSIINNSSSRRPTNRLPSSPSPIDRIRGLAVLAETSNKTITRACSRCHSSKRSKWASCSTSRPCLDKMRFMCQSLQQTPFTWREFQSMQPSEKFPVSGPLFHNINLCFIFTRYIQAFQRIQVCEVDTKRAKSGWESDSLLRRLWKQLPDDVGD